MKEHRLEDILQLTGYEVQPDSDYAQKTSEGRPVRFSKSALRRMYYPKYTSTVISSLSIVDETVINYELLAELLEHITLNNDPGAILVFMPGMMEITKAIEELYKKEFFQSSQVAVFPLHSSLSTAEQTSVFEVPPEGVRKIVVSTNIAETSITIEGGNTTLEMFRCRRLHCLTEKILEQTLCMWWTLAGSRRIEKTKSTRCLHSSRLG